MSASTDRPQDRGRPHRRTRTAWSPATDAILERYREAMRGELETLVSELTSRTAQATLDGSPAPLALGITARKERWDLAIKLGRELAQGEDLEPSLPLQDDNQHSRTAPRLTPAQRRALGG